MRVTAWVVFAGTVLAGHQTDAPSRPQRSPSLTTRAEYVVYYWRAKPGKLDDYSEYIKTVAEPIDESARKDGVFQEVHTYVAAAVTNPSPGDWTHVRVFKLSNGGTPEALSGGLDSATKRMQPDEARRAENSARAAQLREFVKQEVWTELK